MHHRAVVVSGEDTGDQLKQTTVDEEEASGAVLREL